MGQAVRLGIVEQLPGWAGRATIHIGFALGRRVDGPAGICRRFEGVCPRDHWALDRRRRRRCAGRGRGRGRRHVLDRRVELDGHRRRAARRGVEERHRDAAVGEDADRLEVEARSVDRAHVGAGIDIALADVVDADQLGRIARNVELVQPVLPVVVDHRGAHASGQVDLEVGLIGTVGRERIGEAHR